MLPLFKNIYFFQQMEVGPFHNFTYVLGCPDTKKACLIDPGWEGQKFLDILKKRKLKLESILITHHHPDQTESVLELILEKNPKIYVHENEIGRWQHLSPKVYGLKDNDTVKVGELNLKALSTPGHTTDSLCFLFDDKLFTGDTLLVGSCGRCDLPESNPSHLYHSLYTKIKSLPQKLQIYPAHHYGKTPSSTLEKEFQSNPFLNMESEEEFIRFRR